MIERMANEKWAHIRFIRLTSAEEIGRFTAALQSGSDMSPVPAERVYEENPGV
jgi:hypothetical protein